VSPLFRWFRDRRQRRKERREQHAAAWAQEGPGPDGLKPFQFAARDRVDELLGTLGASAQWSVEQLGPKVGPSLTGRAPSVFVEVWIYNDTFGFTVRKTTRSFEWWDFPTPTGMIDEFVSQLKAFVSAAQSR